MIVRTHFPVEVLLGIGYKQAISQSGGKSVIRDIIGSLPTKLHALDTGAGSALGLREQDAWEREVFSYGACITCCTLYMSDVCHPIPTHHSAESALSWTPFTEKGLTGKECAEYLTVSHPGNEAVTCSACLFPQCKFFQLLAPCVVPSNSKRWVHPAPATMKRNGGTKSPQGTQLEKPLDMHDLNCVDILPFFSVLKF